MQIRTLMSRQVITATPRTAIFRVASLMKRKRVSCIVVVENDRPVGVITERDVVRLFDASTHNPRVHIMPVRELMSSSVVTIEEETSLFDALVIAKSRRIRHLPVVDSAGALAGIVTQTNLVDAYMSAMEEQRVALQGALSEHTQALKDANEQLRAMALEDSLLHIGNRRAMEVDLSHTQESSLRYGGTYSVGLVDVDHIKAYNDRYGHVAGDQALRDLAEFLRNSIRASDRIYRYGGEELLLLLPETNSEDARVMTERLLQGVVGLGIRHPTSQNGMLTISCGVSSWPLLDVAPEKTTWRDVLQLADDALYRAKAEGRNQVSIPLAPIGTPESSGAEELPEDKPVNTRSPRPRTQSRRRAA